MALADTLLEQEKRKAEAARTSTLLPDTLAGQAQRLTTQAAGKPVLFSSFLASKFPPPAAPKTVAPRSEAPTVRAKPAQPKTNEPTGWIWPTASTRITTMPETGHIAFDVGALSLGRVGDIVVSPAPMATVEKVGWDPQGYGKYLQLVTPEGFHVILGHLEAVSPGIQAGSVVQGGQEVGLMGSTGASSGAHLHFEIDQPNMGTFGGQRTRSGAIDPRQFYPIAPVSPISDRAGLGAPLSSYDWAPGLGSQEIAAMPTLTPTLPGVGSTYPWVSSTQTVSDKSGERQSKAIQTGSVGMPGGTTPQQAKDKLAAATAPAQTSGIPVLSTPFGDIKIPWPQTGSNPVKSLGELVKRNVVVGIGGLVVLIAIAALLWRNPTVKKAAKTAVKAAAVA